MKMKKYAKFTIFWGLFAIIFTLMVAFFDVGPAGAEYNSVVAADSGVHALNSPEVGFSWLNGEIFRGTEPLQTAGWDKVSDIIMAFAIIVAAGFGIAGLVQLVKKGKIDARIWKMWLVYGAMAIIYAIFEYLAVVNTRPTLNNGAVESSFPSTHVLVVATVLSLMVVALPKYLDDKKARVLIAVISAIATALVMTGRVMSGQHWFTDVLGALLWSLFLVSLYRFLLTATPSRVATAEMKKRTKKALKHSS